MVLISKKFSRKLIDQLSPRLDSFAYRLLWRLKYLLRVENPGPMPIRWLDQPTKSYIPPPLTNLTEKQRESLKMAERELQVLTRCYSYLPSKLETRDWLELANRESTKQRFEHFRFLRQKEHRREKDQKRRNAKSNGESVTLSNENENSDTAKIESEQFSDASTSAFSFSSSATSEICRKRSNDYENFCEEPNDSADSRMRPFFTWRGKTERLERDLEAFRCVRSWLLDPGEVPCVVVDCRFLDGHSPRGLNLCGIQMQQLLAKNRLRIEPWPIWLANFNIDDPAMEQFRRRHLNIIDTPSTFCGDITAKSYMDLFPTDTCRIVYLSPHAKEVLEEVNPGACYVIGGIVDRVREPGIPPKASLMVAEEEGIECRKLPIDQHISWQRGNQLLTLTTVLSILQAVYDSPNGSDWKSALEQHICRRNLRTKEELNHRIRAKYANLAVYNNAILKLLEEKIQQQQQG